MANSLSNLITNLSEGIHRIKCKYKHDDKICETCGIKNKEDIKLNMEDITDAITRTRKEFGKILK